MSRKILPLAPLALLAGCVSYGPQGYSAQPVTPANFDAVWYGDAYNDNSPPPFAYGYGGWYPGWYAPWYPAWGWAGWGGAGWGRPPGWAGGHPPGKPGWGGHPGRPGWGRPPHQGRPPGWQPRPEAPAVARAPGRGYQSPRGRQTP